MPEAKHLPPTEKKDLEHALLLLKSFGAKEVYLFGSMARGDIDEYSDWDIAVRGIPSDKYFTVLGKLLAYMKRNVDLVDLDEDGAFAAHISKKKEFTRVA